MMHCVEVESAAEYEYIVYSSTADSTLRPLRSLTNDALRTPTEAFRSTPTETVHMLANEMLPELRIDHLSLRYYKTRSQLHNPAIRAAIVATHRRLFHNKKSTPHFAVRATTLLEELH